MVTLSGPSSRLGMHNDREREAAMMNEGREASVAQMAACAVGGVRKVQGFVPTAEGVAVGCGLSWMHEQSVDEVDRNVVDGWPISPLGR